ncbi:MAG: D-glycero-beta-D-manno-heptose 1-phosphate adenylyltransferase [Acidimicrobiales bacterium]
MKPVVVVGDALLDRDIDGKVERVCPDAPVPVLDVHSVRSRPGGAGLAATLLAADGRDVTIVTALADDEPGRELRRLLTTRGVRVLALALDGRTPEKVRIRSGGQSLLRIDLGGAVGIIGRLSSGAAAALGEADTILVADYGRGVARHDEVRRALQARPRRGSIVWDPHPRGPAPVVGPRLVTPNAAEAAHLLPDLGGGPTGAAAARATVLRKRWGAAGVSVTMGAAGAVLATPDGPPLVVPAPPVAGGDTCGAGDRFAGAAAGALADGALLTEAVEHAVGAASAFVGAGGAGAFHREPQEPPPSRDRPLDRVLEQIRAAGGTVVATGGCFDLLHAGHVAMLQAARRLGDCLIVCLNSDASVRRLKGPDRPLQSAADRATVLEALDCVDAVVVFEEDTPSAVLEQLRPDLFCKGADYAVADLPERRVLAQWGGHAVVLPYLHGRSTTHLVQEAARHAT